MQVLVLACPPCENPQTPHWWTQIILNPIRNPPHTRVRDMLSCFACNDLPCAGDRKPLACRDEEGGRAARTAGAAGDQCLGKIPGGTDWPRFAGTAIKHYPNLWTASPDSIQLGGCATVETHVLLNRLVFSGLD